MAQRSCAWTNKRDHEPGPSSLSATSRTAKRRKTAVEDTAPRSRAPQSSQRTLARPAPVLSPLPVHMPAERGQKRRWEPEEEEESSSDSDVPTLSTQLASIAAKEAAQKRSSQGKRGQTQTAWTSHGRPVVQKKRKRVKSLNRHRTTVKLGTVEIDDSENDEEPSPRRKRTRKPPEGTAEIIDLCSDHEPPTISPTASSIQVPVRTALEGNTIVILTSEDEGSPPTSSIPRTPVNSQKSPLASSAHRPPRPIPLRKKRNIVSSPVERGSPSPCPESPASNFPPSPLEQDSMDTRPDVQKSPPPIVGQGMQRSPSPIPVDEEDYEEGELQAMYDKAMTDAQQDVGEGDSGSQSPNSYHLCILCRPPGSLPPPAPSSFCSNPEGVPILSQSRFFTLSVPKGLKKQFAPPAVMDLAQSTPSETATLASATPDPQVTGTEIEGDNVGSQVVESKADQPTGMVASPVSPTEPTSPSPPSQPLPSLLMSPKLPPDTVAQNTKDEVHKATHLTPDPNPCPDISSLSTKHPLINLATLNANSPKKPNKTAKLLKRLIDEYRSPSVGSRQGTVDAKPTATTESHSEQSDPPTPLCSPPKVSTERMENDVPTSESSSSVATSEPRQKAKPGPVLQASPAKSADLHRRDSEPEIEEVELLVQPPSSDSDSSPQHPIKCDTTPKASPENDNGAQADLQQGESTGSTSSISASSSTINNTDAGSSGTGSSSEDTQDDSPAPATPPTTGEFKLLNFDLRHFFGLSPSLFKSGDSRRSLDSSGDTNDVDMNVLELELEYPDPSS